MSAAVRPVALARQSYSSSSASASAARIAPASSRSGATRVSGIPPSAPLAIEGGRGARVTRFHGSLDMAPMLPGSAARLRLAQRSGQDQVLVAELVPQVALGEAGRVAG